MATFAVVNKERRWDRAQAAQTWPPSAETFREARIWFMLIWPHLAEYAIIAHQEPGRQSS
jgi:hypothetical protein